MLSRISLPMPRLAVRRRRFNWRDHLSDLTISWIERDQAHLMILDSDSEQVTEVRTRQSAMVRVDPSEESCWWPRDTSQVVIQWVLGLPPAAAIYAWLLNWAGHAVHTLPAVLPWAWFIMFGLMVLPAGFWIGVRAAPKPVWVMRLTPGKGERTAPTPEPLRYQQESIEGALTPQYVSDRAEQHSVREYAEDIDYKPMPKLVVGALIAGVVALVVLLYAVASDDRSVDRGGMDTTTIPVPTSTPIGFEIDPNG